MCLLLETIRIENGLIRNLKYHQARMNQARKELFNSPEPLYLDKIIRVNTGSEGILPQWKADLQSVETGIKNPSTPAFQIANLKEQKEKTIFKCRITYAKHIEKIEFLPYQIPTISSLKLVMNDEIDYSYKFSDRSQLNRLYKKRGNCDDILIVKQGFITDTSYANVLFYNGKEWLTPTHPLLRGTQRASLLERDRIRVADIRPEDLKHFEKARIINAMIRFEDELDINILNIHS
jgi:4-amino-4-deoxychorismate lyase